MTPSSTIMLVDLSVDPSRQAEFDRFYHDCYIPELLRAVPDLLTATRYAQTEVLGELDPAMKRFLTVYELLSDDCNGAIEAGIVKAVHREASDQFKLWKEDGFSYFDRAFYRQVHRHERKSKAKDWSSRSLCTWLWTVKADVPMAGALAYVADYVQQLMDTIESLIACRTYVRLNPEQRSLLTVFEVSEPGVLLQVLRVLESGVPEGDATPLTDWLAATVADYGVMTFDRVYFYSPKSQGSIIK